MNMKTIALTLTLLLGTAGPALAFSDTSAHPAGHAITELETQKLLLGFPDGAFQPDAALTYGEAAVMLTKGLNINLDNVRFVMKPEASQFFANVPDGKWYSDAFIALGVKTVDLPKTLKPDEEVTHEAFAQFVMKAVAQHGEYAYPMQYIDISDASGINPAHVSTVQLALLTKVAGLDAEGKFHPKQPITRGDAASWIYNARLLAGL